MSRRESVPGFEKRSFGPLIPVRRGRWESSEVLVMFGKYRKADVDRIRCVELEARNVGGLGAYTWIDAKVGEWGTGGSNANRLVIKATLVYIGRATRKSKGGATVTDPLLGDLGVTIDWGTTTGDDPYQLLLVTAMMYPVP